MIRGRSIVHMTTCDAWYFRDENGSMYPIGRHVVTAWQYRPDRQGD